MAFKAFVLAFSVLVISSGVTGRHHKQRRASNELVIKPEGPHVKAVGKNLFFTCKANVPNPKLVKDLKWYKANGDTIPEDDRSTLKSNLVMQQLCSLSKI